MNSPPCARPTMPLAIPITCGHPADDHQPSGCTADVHVVTTGKARQVARPTKKSTVTQCGCPGYLHPDDLPDPDK